MRTLIVDDDFTSRLLMQRLLARYGECHLATNGQEAVEAVRVALADRHQYHLVCLDVMMPVMDGLDALREIRRLEAEAGIRPDQGAKVIMTTALGDRDTVLKAVDGQCDWFLVKPIDKTSVLERIRLLGLVP